MDPQALFSNDAAAGALNIEFVDGGYGEVRLAMTV